MFVKQLTAYLFFNIFHGILGTNICTNINPFLDSNSDCFSLWKIQVSSHEKSTRFEISVKHIHSDEELQFELTPPSQLLKLGSTLRYYHSRESKTLDSEANYFHGEIIGQSDSYVHGSLKHGKFFGILRFNKSEILVTPSPEESTADSQIESPENDKESKFSIHKAQRFTILARHKTKLIYRPYAITKKTPNLSTETSTIRTCGLRIMIDDTFHRSRPNNFLQIALFYALELNFYFGRFVRWDQIRFVVLDVITYVPSDEVLNITVSKSNFNYPCATLFLSGVTKNYGGSGYYSKSGHSLCECRDCSKVSLYIPTMSSPFLFVGTLVDLFSNAFGFLNGICDKNTPCQVPATRLSCIKISESLQPCGNNIRNNETCSCDAFFPNIHLLRSPCCLQPTNSSDDLELAHTIDSSCMPKAAAHRGPTGGYYPWIYLISLIGLVLGLFIIFVCVMFLRSERFTVESTEIPTETLKKDIRVLRNACTQLG